QEPGFRDLPAFRSRPFRYRIHTPIAPDRRGWAACSLCPSLLSPLAFSSSDNAAPRRFLLEPLRPLGIVDGCTHRIVNLGRTRLVHPSKTTQYCVCCLLLKFITWRERSHPPGETASSFECRGQSPAAERFVFVYRGQPAEAERFFCCG